jgi:hypothetical protein
VRPLARSLTREQAQAIAIDLARRSTPAEGGFCTFQPVVEGGARPWNLNCHSCDKFVLSGADLLYWRRKREQWRLLTEGAPDDATSQEAQQEATWRERALNAEGALKAAHAEVLQQRTRIGELLGQVRDLEAKWTQDSIQRMTTENTTLKQRVRQLTTDNRTLEERLTAARSNLRFQDRRIADLEAQLIEPKAGK